LLIVEAKPDGDKIDNFKLTLNVEMKGQHGYLSASDWPLYPKSNSESGKEGKETSPEAKKVSNSFAENC